jgi:hypothetical protein
MTPLEIAAILALTAWAVYRQTVVAEITLSPARFRMAAVYAVVGLLVGGFDLPHGWAGWAMIATGLALSVVVGLVRGRSPGSGPPTAGSGARRRSSAVVPWLWCRSPSGSARSRRRTELRGPGRVWVPPAVRGSSCPRRDGRVAG